MAEEKSTEITEEDGGAGTGTELVRGEPWNMVTSWDCCRETSQDWTWKRMFSRSRRYLVIVKVRNELGPGKTDRRRVETKWQAN